MHIQPLLDEVSGVYCEYLNILELVGRRMMVPHHTCHHLNQRFCFTLDGMTSYRKIGCIKKHIAIEMKW